VFSDLHDIRVLLAILSILRFWPILTTRVYVDCYYNK
jgi:hypothetical protein